jgi:hypothetical protein
MKRYDVYLLELGFHPVAVVGKLVHKEWRDSYIQKEKQYTKHYKNRIHKIDNTHTKQENKPKKNI